MLPIITGAGRSGSLPPGATESTAQKKTWWNFLHRSAAAVTNTFKTLGNLKKVTQESLLKPRSPEMQELMRLIKKTIEDIDHITADDIARTHVLLQSNEASLNDLITGLTEDQAQAILTGIEFFKLAAEDAESVKELKNNSEQVKEILLPFYDAFNAALTKKEGALIQASAFLLDEKKGLVTKSLNVIKDKIMDENTGLMRQVMDHIALLLSKESGPLDLIQKRFLGDGQIDTELDALLKGIGLQEEVITPLSKPFDMLTAEEVKTLKEATALLREKCTGKDISAVDLRKQFNKEETATITEALNLAEKKNEEAVIGALALLKRELIGLPELDRAREILSNDFAKLESGDAVKRFKALSKEKKEALKEALKRLGIKWCRERDLHFKEGVALLEARLFLSTGKDLRDEAIRLLNEKSTEKIGVLSNLKQGPLQIGEESLARALDTVRGYVEREKSATKNPETLKTCEAEQKLIATLEQHFLGHKEKMLITALEAIDQNLIEEHSALNHLRQKLLGESDGLIVKVIAQIDEELHKKEGPIDNLDQRLKKILDEALALFDTRLTDKEKGTLTEVSKMLLAAITQGLEMLDQGVNDKEKGIFPKGIKTLQDGLTSAASDLDAKFNGQAHPLLTIARTACNELHKAIVNNNRPQIQKLSRELQGHLEQIEAQRSTVFAALPLTEMDRVTLYALRDGLPRFCRDASLTQRAMQDQIAPGLAALDRYYLKDHGIVPRMGEQVKEALADAMQPVQKGIDDTFEKLNARAHPLLSSARNTCVELQKAIVDNDKAKIKKLSKELEGHLANVEAQREAVFTKLPLTLEDRVALYGLRDHLVRFYADATPPQQEMSDVIAPGLAALDKYYLNDQGHVARAGDNLRETISEAIKPVEPLLKLAQVFTNAAEGSSEPGTISHFLASGAEMLKAALEKGSQFVSEKALQSSAAILCMGTRRALALMENTEPMQAAREALTGVITALEGSHEEGFNWSALGAHMERVAKTLNSVKIYVNGMFRIPHFGAEEGQANNPDTVYAENIGDLKNALDPLPSQPQNQNWIAKAKEEKDALIDNVGKFLTLKYIFEDTCGCKPLDERFYMRLLNEARKKPTAEEAEKELKRLFFEELDKNKVNSFNQFFAGILYYLFGSILKSYTKKVITLYFDEVSNYIEKHQASHFESLRNLEINNLTRYLTVLSGIYKRVAENPVPNGTLDEMVQAELSKKESNRDIEVADLYGSFAKDVLKKATESSLLAWLLKPFVGDPQAIVASIVDKTMGAMQNNGGYAMSSVISEQLEEIWKILIDSTAEERNGSSELPDLTKKSQLSTLVKNLFDVLRKTKCQTLDELRELVKGKLLSAKVNEAFDTLFIEKVIENVTTVLASSIQSLVKPEYLYKLTYQFAHLANNSFELGEEASLEQRQAAEKKISKLSGQILRLVVSNAVEEEFMYTGKKQQKETNQNIDELHKSFEKYHTFMDAQLTQLDQLDLTSPEAEIKINGIVRETLACETEWSTAHIAAKSSQVNVDNKAELCQRHDQISKQSRPLVQTIAQLKNQLRTLENLGAVAVPLNEIKTAIAAVPGRLAAVEGPSEEDLAFCDAQMQTLSRHLETLSKMRHLDALVAQINRDAKVLAELVIDARRAYVLRGFCAAQSQSNALIDQIAAQKKQCLGALLTPRDLKDKFTALKHQISAAALPDALRPQILSKLQEIENAQFAAQIDSACEEYLRLVREALSTANAAFESSRPNYTQAQQRIETAIAESHQLDPNMAEQTRADLRTSIAQAKDHLRTLNSWEQTHIKQVPYLNIQVLETKGFQDVATGIVFNRVHERLDGLVEFLKREDTFRYGLLNHLFLLPYVQMIAQKA